MVCDCGGQLGGFPLVVFSVWTGACYWNGVGGFMFNSSSSAPDPGAQEERRTVDWGSARVFARPFCDVLFVFGSFLAFQRCFDSEIRASREVRFREGGNTRQASSPWVAFLPTKGRLTSGHFLSNLFRVLP